MIDETSWLVSFIIEYAYWEREIGVLTPTAVGGVPSPWWRTPVRCGRELLGGAVFALLSVAPEVLGHKHGFAPIPIWKEKRS
jgi:hypothetical protein